MATILNGTELSLKIKENLRGEIWDTYLLNKKPVPKLAVVLVGENVASRIYVTGKIKACSAVGIESVVVELPYNTTQAVLEDAITNLNKDKSVNGILLQLPLPSGLNQSQALNLISPQKDVDGLTNVNLGKLISGDPTALAPCTPSGILALLHHHDIDVEGKDVVIINRSILVGKPLAIMLTKLNATVTLCHTKTNNLQEKIKNADIIITAVGKKNFITADSIKKGAVVVDVSIVRTEGEKKICGDCDFENVATVASAITPVPGGVGPMTIALLLSNTIKATRLQNDKDTIIE